MSVDRRTFAMGAAALGLAGCAAGPVGSRALLEARMPEAETDPKYQKPFIDKDEWRDTPVRHRYVHGGFEGTELLFSIYLPPKEQYQGRFFQPLAATSGAENSAPMAMFQASGVGFALDSGGFMVESNQGARDMFGGSYQANEAVARYARKVAAEMYGQHRAYGYVYGGSGGAFKTLGCVENSTVWDGAIPFVHGTPVAIPNFFTIQAHAMRVLGPKFPQIVDAIEPGGSGDMYAGLTQEEREALIESNRFGMPTRAWFNHRKIAVGYTGVFTTLVDRIVDGDPTYFEDFWSKPGYLGHTPPKSLTDARVQHPTKIASLIMPEEAKRLGLTLSMPAAQANSGVTFPAAFRFENLPKGNLQGASVIVKTGGAKDALLYITQVTGDVVSIGFGQRYFRALAALKPGDEVVIDNSVYLAVQTYHRHQIPASDFYVWDQYKDASGKPLYPQRKLLAGGDGEEQSGGSRMNGKFNGKIIVVEAMMDEAAYPWGADWFRNRVKRQGNEDRYRLYFVDNTMHTTQNAAPGDARPVATTRVISYQGVLQQALRDLAAWVEDGVAPPQTTSYQVKDGQVIVPDSASARKGIQPVVNLTANGRARADVKVGEAVSFEGVIEAPPGTGSIVSAEWDFEGGGEYAVASAITPASRVTVSQTFSFSRPGTYFPALRVASRRDGKDSAYAKPLNLGRVRVVVT